MAARTMHCLGVAILLLAPGNTRAQHGGGGHMHGGGGGPMVYGGGHHHGMGGLPLAAVGPGYGYAGYGVAGFGYGLPPIFVGGGYYSSYNPALMPWAFNGFGPGSGMMSPPMPVRGPRVLAPPQPGAAWPNGNGNVVKPTATRNDPARAAQLLKFGDRLFRAGNLKKAEERYLQALHVASNQAAPHFRLAQIALTRGHYAAAANRLRDAETAEPGWVLTAPDVQSLYGEPTEFAQQVARLESYVQAHPDDRDAWLVLGAQWLLSGRTGRAADVFLRLDDPHRKRDVALSAFIIASNHMKPKPSETAERAP